MRLAIRSLILSGERDGVVVDKVGAVDEDRQVPAELLESEGRQVVHANCRRPARASAAGEACLARSGARARRILGGLRDVRVLAAGHLALHGDIVIFNTPRRFAHAAERLLDFFDLRILSS